jgi:hypothetical protein
MDESIAVASRGVSDGARATRDHRREFGATAAIVIDRDASRGAAACSDRAP